MRIYSKNHISPYRLKNPNYQKAITKVQSAIKKGTLIRLSCARCGNKKTFAHHPFYRYSKPLEVIWLCGKHHKIVHAEEKLKTTPTITNAIEQKNQQLERVEKSINFYLDYHKIPEPSRTMIAGNLLQVFIKELKIF